MSRGDDGPTRRMHIRNVPDEVYEALQRAAAASGRSLSAEFVAIMEGQLLSRSFLPLWRPVNKPPPP